MRILIAGPPKSGNWRLRCLLAAAYGLRGSGGREAPDEANRADFMSWMGAIPDQSVVSAAFHYQADVAERARADGIDLMAIIRHPYDLFVSSVDVTHQRALRSRMRSRSSELAPEKTPLDDCEVLAYARGGFADEVTSLVSWQESRFPVVRFEHLERNAAAVLTALSPSFGTLTDDEVARAIAICPPESAILSRPERGRRMPALPADSWRHRLPGVTLDQLQERYADAVRRLGYEIA